jgi:predicted O-methyltransferase YrrM
MKFSKLIIVAFVLLPYCQTHSFNVSYTGTDPEVSYQMHIPHERDRFIKEDYFKYFQYFKKYIEKLKIFNPYTINIKKLPSPYNQLRTILPYASWGMYFNYAYIEKLLACNRIVDVVEIGSLYGLSTRHIATLLPEHGKVLAIDTWAYHDLMYEQFLSNVVLTGLTQKIVPIKKRSDQAIDDVLAHASAFDLIYVDGDHEMRPVIKDLEMYYPLLKKTGVICGDDWLLYTVRAAVLIFAQMHELTVYGACNFWFLKDEGTGFACKSFIDADEHIWHFQD